MRLRRRENLLVTGARRSRARSCSASIRIGHAFLRRDDRIPEAGSASVALRDADVPNTPGRHTGVDPAGFELRVV